MIYDALECIELPILDNGVLVAYCPDIPVTLHLDECGDLWRVSLHEYRTERRTVVCAGRIWEACKELMETDGDRIRDEAGFSGSRRERDIAPTYGVGFSGGRYAA